MSAGTVTAVDLEVNPPGTLNQKLVAKARRRLYPYAIRMRRRRDGKYRVVRMRLWKPTVTVFESVTPEEVLDLCDDLDERVDTWRWFTGGAA